MDEDESFQVDLDRRAVSFRLRTNNGLDHIAGLVARDGLGNYEAPLPDLMAWLVRSSHAPMLDVGANTGLFSLLSAAANSQVKIYAFEPLESVRTLLHANLKINKSLAARIGVYGIGLSNADGTFDFYETINEYGLVTTSSSLELDHAIGVGAYRKQTIQTKTLDGWAVESNLSAVNLMKIDVEGHEYAVVDGGRKTIRRFRPMITIEVLEGSRTDTIERMMFEENYIDFVIVPNGLRHPGVLGFHPDGWNHLLCPAEKLGVLLHACRDLRLKLDIQ